MFDIQFYGDLGFCWVLLDLMLFCLAIFPKACLVWGTELHRPGREVEISPSSSSLAPTSYLHLPLLGASLPSILKHLCVLLLLAVVAQSGKRCFSWRIEVALEERMFKEESAEEMRPNTRKSWVWGVLDRATRASFTGFFLDLERWMLGLSVWLGCLDPEDELSR